MSAPLIGKRVRISELKSRPDLNGTLADVLFFNEESSRYTVRLHTDEQIALRSTNLVTVRAAHIDEATELTYPQGTRVKVRGLQGRAELNGQSGMVVSWDAEKGRLGVQVDGVVKPLALLAENVELLSNEWKPDWRTAAGEAAIKEAEAEHIAKEWENAKGGPFGNMGGGS
jgi:hypothetical protein